MNEQPVVLWVDDDPLHVAATLWLEDAGMRVLSATTYEQASNLILSEPRIDIAILDVNVRTGSPDIDDGVVAETKGGTESGLALARLIRRRRSDLPFIGISAFLSEPIVEWFRNNGAGFLTKADIRESDEFVPFVRSRLHESSLGSTPQEASTMTKASTDNTQKRAEELQVSLRQLELEYDLAKQAMAKGGHTTMLAAVAVLLTTAMGFAATMWGRREFLSGTHIVLLVAVVAVALLAFSSLVFGRAFKLKTQITKTKKELEVILGESVR